MAVTCPTYVILLASKILDDEATSGDLVFSRLLVGLVLLEFFADGQQWSEHLDPQPFIQS